MRGEARVGGAPHQLAEVVVEAQALPRGRAAEAEGLGQLLRAVAAALQLAILGGLK